MLSFVSVDAEFAAFDAAALPSELMPTTPAGQAAATPCGPTETAARSVDAEALSIPATVEVALFRESPLLVADEVADAAAGPSPCWASVIA